MPRFSLDWDLFIPPRDAANLERINAILESEAQEGLEPFSIFFREQARHGKL
jgi:hypothetical protein